MIIAIITARGHASDTLREGVEYFVETMFSDAQKAKMVANLRKFRCHFDGKCVDDELTAEQLLKEYFDLNRYFGVSNPAYLKKLGLEDGADSPEKGKKHAIHEFVHHIGELLKQSNKVFIIFHFCCYVYVVDACGVG